ncbi:protein phosphatase 2C domain-containing protein [Sphingosinicella sp. LHD-64]|uniref:PP2C family protein-serine/threonine phosphatase n=1 Tax=Sphingosinicella sp. LHD-64 TaxID=3072139 RepID=UPI002810712A|nr:protein phosphatase 2C domain-containing protein [Sphingosinicella sp. LHD-64]MDQ8757651.1 protein phosphatase 2C domain-containing protein [Sphingosinicella sp. LHD-64]
MQLAPFRIESDARTHEGRVRDHNEDSFYAQEPKGLWAVADGMGGHEGGEWASAKIVEKLGDVDLPHGFDPACEAIEAALQKANRAILVEARQRRRQMGSTVVSLLVQDGRYAVLWVGDSRAYVLRDGELKQLSRDHTQVQEMVDRGIMRPEEAVGHPMGHILSRAVGVRDEMDVDKVTGDVVPGDVFLLCSDGLHGYVDEADITRLLARGSPDRATEELVALTLANGAPDNVTVVAIWASEPTLLSIPGSVNS